MKTKYVLNAGVLALVAAIFLQNGVHAQDKPSLPKSGSIHVHTGIGSTYQDSEVVKGRIQGTGVDNGVVFNDRGAGPLHLGSQQCSYAYVSDDGKGRHSGFCAWIDSDGDALFSDFQGTGDVDGKSKGMNQITGGTGKFSGVTGTGPYECAGIGRSGTYCKVRLDYRLP